MSNHIEEWFVKQFGSTVDTLAQQKGSRLRRTVRRQERVRGRYTFIDQIGATTAVEITTRYEDSPLIQTPHARRRATMKNIAWGELIDGFDKARMLIDPANAYVQNAGYAIGRKMDDIIIEALYSDAYSGEEGNTVVPFPASQVIASGGTGLTVAKLRQARKMLRAADVDLQASGPIWCVVHAEQIDDLLGDTNVTSADYNTVRTLVAGEVESFLGFNFVHVERLPTNASNERRVFVYTSDALALAIGEEPNSRIAPRPDKRFMLYAYWETVFGATRLEEVKVVEIDCVEA